MKLAYLTFISAMCVTNAAAAYDINNWPTSYTTQSGFYVNTTGNYQYDANRFHDSPRLKNDDDTNFRRKEFGIGFGQKDIWDTTINYDFESQQWLDVAFRVESKAIFGKDVGKFRVGYLKVPFGLEGVLTSSRSSDFVEFSAPMQAFAESRRTGADWNMERTHYSIQLALYGGKDLQGKNPGTTQALRAVWIPIRTQDTILHFGISSALEHPRGFNDGGVSFSPQMRFRARPEAGLTAVRLVDTGVIGHVDSAWHNGVEGLFIHGPFSVQSEYLNVNVKREDGLPGYVGHGQYIFGTYTLTGESRMYSVNGVGNVKPTHAYGAVELLARYSHLDLNDGLLQGGEQSDWTVGANWYLTTHFKFQANYVRLDADRRGVRTQPRIFEVRAQVMF